MRLRPIAALLLLATCARDVPPAPHLILWAWERPEDVRFAPEGVEIAVQSGFVEIDGSTLRARGRRFPLRTARQPATSVVHVQIAHDRPLVWSTELRRQVSQAVLDYATRRPMRRVQIDFEVRASERQELLDVLADVRAALPTGVALSMTALASWCDDERWLDTARVDEIVPMLFRMGSADRALRERLARGGDFANPRCRSALGIATDTPIARAPSGRRVYIFAPHSWTRSTFVTARREVEGWR